MVGAWFAHTHKTNSSLCYLRQEVVGTWFEVANRWFGENYENCNRWSVPRRSISGPRDSSWYWLETVVYNGQYHSQWRSCMQYLKLTVIQDPPFTHKPWVIRPSLHSGSARLQFRFHPSSSVVHILHRILGLNPGSPTGRCEIPLCHQLPSRLAKTIELNLLRCHPQWQPTVPESLKGSHGTWPIKSSRNPLTKSECMSSLACLAIFST